MKNQPLVSIQLLQKQNIPKQNRKSKPPRACPQPSTLLTFSNLDAAQKAIDDGEIALDRAWAENEVNNAQIPINNVDKVIEWFKANAAPGMTHNSRQLLRNGKLP